MSTPKHHDEQRYEQGKALMNEVLGEEKAETTRTSLTAMHPDFAQYVVKAGFADIYSRGTLTLQQRELLNVAVLTAIGGAEPQLALHIEGALNVGVTPDEVTEAIIHVALYAGHPRTINGLKVAQETIEKGQAAKS